VQLSPVRPRQAPRDDDDGDASPLRAGRLVPSPPASPRSSGPIGGGGGGGAFKRRLRGATLRRGLSACSSLTAASEVPSPLSLDVAAENSGAAGCGRGGGVAGGSPRRSKRQGLVWRGESDSSGGSVGSWSDEAGLGEGLSDSSQGSDVRGSEDGSGSDGSGSGSGSEEEEAEGEEEKAAGLVAAPEVNWSPTSGSPLGSPMKWASSRCARGSVVGASDPRASPLSTVSSRGGSNSAWNGNASFCGGGPDDPSADRSRNLRQDALEAAARELGASGLLPPLPAATGGGGRRSGRHGGGSSAPPHDLWLYIQMQFCSGNTLREWLDERRSRVDVGHSLQVFSQIARGLEYVHGEAMIQ
jgi:hypothetical protein